MFFIGNFFSKEIHIILERLMHLDNKFDADLAFDFDHIIECVFVFGLVFSFFLLSKKFEPNKLISRIKIGCVCE